MKKSLIWLLTAVMSVTFGALLYFQIMYLENMVNMRKEQFSEIAMRCLSATGAYLERRETLHFLEQDVAVIESSLLELDETTPAGISFVPNPLLPNSGTIDNIRDRYRTMQETLRGQYLYQKGLLNEVILSILRDAGTRPAVQRADSTVIREYLSNELKANGLEIPFDFSVTNGRKQIVYETAGFERNHSKNIFSQDLFPHTDSQLKLNVEFPTQTKFIFSSVRFVIPTLIFTLILLIVFLYTIIMAFRQKKLSEIKTDFIHNMTHELKTPISTISLASQMLGDPSVRKSESSLNRLSSVIADESKRLQFQVEKVLQMSVFDNSPASLKMAEVNADEIIQNVVNTFKIKVERFGGTITCNLNAENPIVKVDQMHFTNLIHNLLDNAIKYRDEDKEPHLSISTSDKDGKYLQIKVSDNGIGIKKEDLKRIFDKFYRVPTGNRHDVKGFGLGLAYVKKMVEIFGGSIHAESEFGKGSTFVILLPLDN